VSDADDLRRAIESAFAPRPYPGDDRIADSDPRYESYEGHAVTRFHRGKHWREITLGHLREEYGGDATACLAFMTAEGWRYYLPAYLLIALEWEEADAVGDTVIGNLTHPRALAESYARVADDLGLEREEVLRGQTARFEERLSGLDHAEIQAARALLSYVAERIDTENRRLGHELPNAARTALGSWASGGPDRLMETNCRGREAVARTKA
jgi:hypothetical protein